MAATGKKIRCRFKTARFEFVCSPAELKLLKKAATKQGATLSGFLRTAGVEKAAEVLKPPKTP